MFGFIQKSENHDLTDFSEENEKSAIISTVTTETELAFKGDFEKSSKYYLHSYYTFIAYNYTDGTFFVKVGSVLPETSDKITIETNNLETVKQSNYPKVKRRNFVFKFYTPKVAFVTWDQYNSDKEIKMFYYSKETRIMEKQDGLWKIANMTAFWDYKNLIPVESLK
jgi:hypothetical protein